MKPILQNNPAVAYAPGFHLAIPRSMHSNPANSPPECCLPSVMPAIRTLNRFADAEFLLWRIQSTAYALGTALTIGAKFLMVTPR